MAGLFSTIANSNRAVLANQYAIEVISHNVANANTKGYRRQSVLMKAGLANSISAANFASATGQLGTGVVLDSITRYTNTFLDQQYRLATAEVSKYQYKSNILTQMESVLGETTDTGIIAVLDNFWDAWQSLAGDPTDDSLRTLVREQGRLVADSISSRMEELDQLAKDQETNVLDRVMEINSIADQITSLNVQIGQAIAADLQPNDLLDQRDLLLDRLAEVAGAVSYENKYIQNISTGEWHDTGQISVSIGGHVLVAAGSAAEKLTYNTITNTFKWDDNQPYNGYTGEMQGISDAIDIIRDQMDGLNTLANGIIKWVNDVHQTSYIASDALNITNADTVLNIDTGNFWLGGNGTASVDILTVEDPDAVLDGTTPTAASAVFAGNTELGTGDYIVETRDNNGVLQFRLLDIDGDVVGIDNGAGAITTEWQDFTGGTAIDTGRGLTFTFNAAATDGLQVRVNYTAAGIDMTDAGQVGDYAIDATDSLSTIAQKINNTASLQNYGRVAEAVVVDNQLYLVPAEVGSAHGVIATSDLTTAGVVPPDGDILAGDPILNFPSGVTVEAPSKFFEGEDDVLGPAYAIRLSADVKDSIDNINPSISVATAGDGVIAQALADGRYSDNFPMGLIEGTTLYKRENANNVYNVQVTTLGLEIKYAETGAEYEGTIANALYTQRESFCGVSLEEEAVNLLKYQRAFQAAARVITTANEMLGRIIDQLAA